MRNCSVLSSLSLSYWVRTTDLCIFPAIFYLFLLCFMLLFIYLYQLYPTILLIAVFNKLFKLIIVCSIQSLFLNQLYEINFQYFIMKEKKISDNQKQIKYENINTNNKSYKTKLYLKTKEDSIRQQQYKLFGSKTGQKQQINLSQTQKSKIKMKKNLASLLASQQNKWFYGSNYCQSTENKNKNEKTSINQSKKTKKQVNQTNELQYAKKYISVLLQQAMKGQSFDQSKVESKIKIIQQNNMQQNQKLQIFELNQRKRNYLHSDNPKNKNGFVSPTQNNLKDQKIRRRKIEPEQMKNKMDIKKFKSQSNSKSIFNTQKLDQLGSNKQLVFKTRQKVRRTPLLQAQTLEMKQKLSDTKLENKCEKRKEKRVKIMSCPSYKQKQFNSKPKIEYASKHLNHFDISLLQQAKHLLYKNDYYGISYSPVTLSLKEKRYDTLNQQIGFHSPSKSVLRRVRFNYGKKVHTENSICIL